MSNYPKANRPPITQLLDYRIFIVSCYHKDELGDARASLEAGMNIQSEDSFFQSTENDNYFFFRYSIDNYVTSFNITRNIDGTPGTLNLTLFPTFNKTRNNSDGEFDFMYRVNDTLYPVFRRMDYIEIQVASDTTILDGDFIKRATVPGQVTLKTILGNTDKYSNDYVNTDLPYKVRFKGFIHSINESDSADGGLQLNIQASSMLYYLANSPFLSSAALLSTNYEKQSQQIFILSNTYITLWGDLLHDLRDTTKRATIMLQQIFRTSSDIEKGSVTSLGYSKRIDNSSKSAAPILLQSYKSISSSFRPTEKIIEIFRDLDSGENGTAISNNTQSGLIQLAEFYIGFIANTVSSQASEIFNIYRSDLFDQEITPGGDNQNFISKYVYTLQVLNEFKQTIKYILYEKANGTIVYDRPRFDNPIDFVIPDQLYVNYDYTESSNGMYTDVFVLPGTAWAVLSTDLREVLMKSSGGGLYQQRRFGYRRPEPVQSPNVGNGLALLSFAKTEKAVNNAQLSTLKITIPYDCRYEIGSIIWFKRKNFAGMVVSMNERITYGGQSLMDITISYLRKVINADNVPTEFFNKHSKEIVTFKDPDYNINYHLIISQFPEYTFVNDFYNTNLSTIQSDTTSADIEREVIQ